jgi:hypothetical protein
VGDIDLRAEHPELHRAHESQDQADEEVHQRDDGERARAAVLYLDEEVRAAEPCLPANEAKEREAHVADEVEGVDPRPGGMDRRVPDALQDGKPRCRRAGALPLRDRGGLRQEPRHAARQAGVVDVDPELRAPREHGEQEREQAAVPAGEDGGVEGHPPGTRLTLELAQDGARRRESSPQLPLSHQREAERSVIGSHVPEIDRCHRRCGERRTRHERAT